ncbi:MAG: hypothetical protein LBR79_02420 [Oscillospiraceae bacterium]|nr:hypothetical protein [Oscillospiraceae bacterium]
MSLFKKDFYYTCVDLFKRNNYNTKMFFKILLICLTRHRKHVKVKLQKIKNEGAQTLDLSVNFTDCNQNRRRRMKILQGNFDAKPFFK